jgi:hypothetical protein
MTGDGGMPHAAALVCSRRTQTRPNTHKNKSFWFFFSKKNRFLDRPLFRGLDRRWITKLD